jgi:hypothetical protein
MAYGVKRGFRPPGEYRLVDILSLGFSSAVGILAALTADLTQKGEAAAVFKINQWAVDVTRTAGMGVDMPLWGVGAGLVGFGAASVLYFQPTTRIGAFFRGFGLLAALMTATPPDLAGGVQAVKKGSLSLLQAVADVRDPAAPVEGPQDDGAILSVRRGNTAGPVEVGDVDREARYEVSLTIHFPNGAPKDFAALASRDALRGRLHNEGTGETFELFESAGGLIEASDDAIVVKAGVPAKSVRATLWVRIECEGYAIELQSAEAALGEPLDWRVDMRPSKTPLMIQRLGKSYWF